MRDRRVAAAPDDHVILTPVSPASARSPTRTCRRRSPWSRPSPTTTAAPPTPIDWTLTADRAQHDHRRHRQRDRDRRGRSTPAPTPCPNRGPAGYTAGDWSCVLGESHPSPATPSCSATATSPPAPSTTTTNPPRSPCSRRSPTTTAAPRRRPPGACVAAGPTVFDGADRIRRGDQPHRQRRHLHALRGRRSDRLRRGSLGLRRWRHPQRQLDHPGQRRERGLQAEQRRPAGHVTLVKTVVNDNGGTAEAEDWTLSATGPESDQRRHRQPGGDRRPWSRSAPTPSASRAPPATRRRTGCAPPSRARARRPCRWMPASSPSPEART